ATTAVTESTTTPVIIDPTNYKNEQMSANEIHNGNLIVIDENNVYHNVTPTSDNDRIVSLYNKSGFHTSYWLRNSKIGARYGIIGDLNALLTRFRIQFPDVFVTGSKTLIYAGAPLAGSTAVVDYTNENTSGLGIDLRVYTSDGKVRKLSYSEYTWIAANCAEYGFIISDPSDPYHLRYVGKEHAKYITDNGLTLSEYVSLVKSYTYASPLKMVSSGSVYSVYYVRSTGAMTNVSVPIGKEYTISGNNIDGFIVTVKG
ncbi:MAG: hypothetical protein MJ101_07505, partial [Clostridia bacterium]|nr:hypothetical protein [Clostridia bacterium]